MRLLPSEDDGHSIPTLCYQKIVDIFFVKQKVVFYYVKIKSLRYHSGKFEVRVPSVG